MKIKTMLILLILSCFILGSCTNHKHSTSITDYGHWDSSASKILYENFSTMLPSEKLVEDYGQSYYYSSSQGLFAERSIVVGVKLKFQTSAEYHEVLEQYQSYATDSIVNGNIEYYTMQYSHEKFFEYNDEKILDGMYYNFSVFSSCESELTIQIVNAHVWDSYKDQYLIDYLSNMQKTGTEDLVLLPTSDVNIFYTYKAL